MGQNPCWKANQFSPNQEFLILLESEVALPHLQVPANYSYPGRIKQVHATPSQFLMINLNITLPSTPGTCKCSLSLRFPHQYPVCNSHLPQTCYMPISSHSSRFDHPKIFWWGLQVIKLHNMYFTLLPCYHFPLRPRYPYHHPTLKHSEPRSTLNKSQTFELLQF